MGDTVQEEVACDEITNGLNAMDCIGSHIISDFSTVVVLWPFSICNCLPPLFRAGFAQPLSELIFCHIYHTDCAMFNLFHTHQHIFHTWSYIFFNILWCTNTKRCLSNQSAYTKFLHSCSQDIPQVEHSPVRFLFLASFLPQISDIIFFLNNLRPNHPHKKPWLTLGTRFSYRRFLNLGNAKRGEV